MPYFNPGQNTADMSTAKALEIDFYRANLHYDVMRATRPVQGPVLTAQLCAVRFNCVRQHQNWESRHWKPILVTD